MLKALIIDDEINGAQLLEHLVKENCPNINVTAIETLAEAAVDLIKKHKPDLIFLDIQMPGLSGFELLEKVKHLSFHVIFTTAHDHYALKAFKYNTIDYLLKPVIVSELVAAVAKLEALNKRDAQSIEQLLKSIQAANGRGKLAVSSQNEIVYIDTEAIIRLESDSNYTRIFLADGKKITSAKTLKEYEGMLDSRMFFRTHKTFLVNLDQVEKFVKSDGGYLIMKDKSQIPVSREKRQELMDLLAIR